MTSNHNHFTREIKTLGECPGCDEYNQVQARKILVNSQATLADIRMKIREQLIYGGYNWLEADALILLHEAAVKRA